MPGLVRQPPCRQRHFTYYNDSVVISINTLDKCASSEGNQQPSLECCNILTFCGNDTEHVFEYGACQVMT